MAEVRPFAGLRYDPAVVGDLASVVCPPYDVIPAEAQREYYQRSPYNAIRLELPLSEPNEAPGERYRHAGRTFREWLRAGVLKPEARPAIYVYDQEFSLYGRTQRRRGLAVALRLEEWSRGVVLPHEATHAKPKADRLALMRACAANLSPLFALYDDQRGVVAEELGRATQLPPTVELLDEQGDRHALWVISEPALVAAVAAALSEQPLYMADGHHRYETALAYRDEQPQRGGSGDEAYRFVLTVLSAVEDRGLVILPTHRVVRGVDPMRLATLLQVLERWFTVEPLPDDEALLREALAEVGRDAPAFGICAPALGDARVRLLRLRDAGAAAAHMPQDHSAAWRQLDVSVAHALILEQSLGLVPEMIEDQVVYTRDAAEALRAVREGQGQLALLLNATRVAQVCAVAQARDRMPQKSTYFYPKVLTGLVVHHLAGRLPDPRAAATQRAQA